MSAPHVPPTKTELDQLRLSGVMKRSQYDRLIDEIECLRDENEALTMERDKWKAECDRLLALRTRAAYWHGVADMFSIEKYGHPCDADPDVEAWKAALVKPLVEALREAGAVLSEWFGDSEDCGFRLGAVMAHIAAALAPHKPACSTCKGTHYLPHIMQYDPKSQTMVNIDCPDCAGGKKE